MVYRFKQLILLLGDWAVLYAGLYLAVATRYFGLPGQNLTVLLAPMTHLFFLSAIVMFVAGLYDISRAKNSWNFYQKVIVSAFAWIIIGVIYFYARPENYINPKTILFLTALFGFGLIALWRYFHNKFLSPVLLKINVVFAGITPETMELIKILMNEPQRGYEVSGLIYTSGAMLPAEVSRLPHAPTLSELASATGRRTVNLVVVAPHLTAHTELLKELYSGLFNQIGIKNLAKFYEEITGRIPPFTFSEGWFLTNFNEQEKKIYDRGRLLADFILAIVMGGFFAASFIIIAPLVKITSSGPLFFRQKRTGKLGKEFTIYKYRTMKALTTDGSAELSGPQYAAAGDSRITLMGKFLRRTRLDELPQFINILKNEMGVIGPRPERPEFVRTLTAAMPYYTLRHLIKPGLTGWAQLHNSYYGTTEENLRKLEYDLYYIKNRGFILDLSIVLKTISVIFRLAGR